MKTSELTETILRRETARLMRDVLGLDEFPVVGCNLGRPINEDGVACRIMCPDGMVTRLMPESALLLSLDDFSEQYLLPMLSSLYGMPLMDEGRMVFNPVHDAPEAA